ncbi:hypothetical protein CNR22_02910 [Sphingobacteriaceae bacterium]|nr:hypothetical protein CNR22_02910 [Sphingobacteriaceae bacterium]
MKSILFLSVFFICSCNPRVYRVNYTTQSKDYWDCGVPVKKNMALVDTLVKVGDVKLGDCGSKKQNEEQSIAVLKNEGCALDADVVNITKENSKEEWATCYQCEAEFYVKKKPESPTYLPPKKKMTGAQKWELTSSILIGTSLIVFLMTHTAIFE